MPLKSTLKRKDHLKGPFVNASLRLKDRAIFLFSLEVFFQISVSLIRYFVPLNIFYAEYP